MTIEQKALELVNAKRNADGNLSILTAHGAESMYRHLWPVLCRALEAHELDKARHAAELREQAERFSEAVEQLEVIPDELVPFILAPDPLVEAVQDWWDADGYNDVANLRAALDARGLAIVKKEAVNG